MPPGLDYVWGWFCELSQARGTTGFGPAPLGYADLAAWAAFNRLALTSFERETILALDRAYLAHAARQKGKP